MVRGAANRCGKTPVNGAKTAKRRENAAKKCFQTLDKGAPVYYNNQAYSRSAYGLRRKVTAKSVMKPTEQIISADKCRGATPATNRGFFLFAPIIRLFLCERRDTHG